MALWRFGKKNEEPKQEQERADAPVTPADGDGAAEQAEATSISEDTKKHDAVNGDMGPFDGDSVNIEDFDFSEFSNGVLNLGSMKLPLPKESQIQLEMGEDGPRMLHVVTRYGRITPVAFAAATSAAQWRQAVTEIMEKMGEDGLDPQIEDGPWGREVVATGTAGMIRLIGVDGPRWMLRFTVAGPLEVAEELTKQARELIARTFVYRGDAPILAGNSLPVSLPEQLVEQVNQAMQERAAAQGQGQEGQEGSNN